MCSICDVPPVIFNERHLPSDQKQIKPHKHPSHTDNNTLFKYGNVIFSLIQPNPLFNSTNSNGSSNSNAIELIEKVCSNEIRCINSIVLSGVAHIHTVLASFTRSNSDCIFAMAIPPLRHSHTSFVYPFTQQYAFINTTPKPVQDIDSETDPPSTPSNTTLRYGSDTCCNDIRNDSSSLELLLPRIATHYNLKAHTITDQQNNKYTTYTSSDLQV